MERGAGADAIGHGRGGAHHDRTAHAVAGRADLALLLDRGCASSHAMNAFASVTWVVAFRPCASGITILRTSGSAKLAPAGTTGDGFMR